jgi:negative regulator of flagellin synthesis FlgM
MKIVNDKQVGVLDTLVRSTNNKPLKETAADGKVNKNDVLDKVELSSRKQEVQTVRDKVNATPVIRQDKVDQIKSEMKAETYNVKGELVARSLLKSTLLDEIL